jgi:hypothetical protein
VKSRSDKLERSLRDNVRRRLRASPTLWAENQQARRARRYSCAALIALSVLLPIGAVVLLGLPLLVAAMIDIRGGTDALLATLGVGTTAAAFWMAIDLVGRLHLSEHRWVLAHLPICDAEIAAQCWRKTVKRSAIALHVALLGSLALIAALVGSSFGGPFVMIPVVYRLQLPLKASTVIGCVCVGAFVNLICGDLLRRVSLAIVRSHRCDLGPPSGSIPDR